MGQPMNRVPEDLACIVPTQVRIGGGSEIGEDGAGAVVVLAFVKSLPVPVGLTFDTPEQVEEFIGMLREISAEVWPTPGPPR